jgi:hypothetical protein
MSNVRISFADGHALADVREVSRMSEESRDE